MTVVVVAAAVVVVGFVAAAFAWAFEVYVAGRWADC